MTAKTTAAAPPSHLSQMAQEWKASWKPGMAALIGGSLSYSLWAGVSSLFVVPLQNEFGWSRGEIAAANYGGLIIAFTAPFIGRLVDSTGVRPVLLTGLALVSCCYALLSMMPGWLPFYYGAYFLLNLFGMATTGITFTRIITGAFTRTRGTALALARSGLAISCAVVPLALFPIIARFGSTGGFLTLALLAALVALPLVYFLVPEMATKTVARSDAEGASKWRTLLEKPKVRIICLAAMFNYAPVVAILSQLQPIGLSKGLDEGAAVLAISVLGLSASFGALLSGVLVDRFWAPAVAAVLTLLPAAGCVSLAMAGGDVHPAFFFMTIFLVGLGQGAEIDIVAFMIARYFGLRNYSTIYGLSVLCIALSTAVSASLIGSAYDAFGHYDVALTACGASFALAAICYLAMGRYPDRTTVDEPLPRAETPPLSPASQRG